MVVVVRITRIVVTMRVDQGAAWLYPGARGGISTHSSEDGRVVTHRREVPVGAAGAGAGREAGRA
jgi:hypothetical protein